MDLEKRYYTIDGVKCNILRLVKAEPEWAANRTQEGERAIAALIELKAAVRKLSVEWKAATRPESIVPDHRPDYEIRETYSLCARKLDELLKKITPKATELD
uniref:Uncharacterized protein n=1 Tax=viral metagenome TaxID=1070528 RepID=A0A6M3JPL0_9ZZZZ